MKKLLVTGVNGFVGQHFLEYTLAHKPDITVIGTGRSKQSLLTHKNYEYRCLDLNNQSGILNLLEHFKPDYILHLASYSSVSESWKKPVDSFSNNTNIFLNLIDSVRTLNLNSRILSIGSSEQYGQSAQTISPLHEQTPLLPNSPYAVARTAQEMLALLYVKNYNTDIILTRSFNHIGPKQKDTFVVPSFVRQLIQIARNGGVLHTGDTSVIRDFTDIRDIISAYWLLLEYGELGETYNVCSGNGVQLCELINTISSLLNIKPEIRVDSERIRPSENPSIIGDNSKLKKLGWTPAYSLTQTLDDMIQYWS